MTGGQRVGLGAALLGVTLSQIAVWPGDDPFEWPKVFAAAACFLAAFALFPPRGQNWLRWPLLAPMAAYEASFLVAILASGDWKRGLLGSEAVADGFVVIALGSLVVLWVAGHSDAPDVGRKILGSLVIGAAIAALYGIAQRLRLDPIPWSLDDPLFAALRNRVFGPLGNPSFLGMTLSMALPASIVLSASRGSRAGLWWFAAIPIGIALALTASRGGIVGAASGLVVAGVMLRGSEMPRRLWVGIGVAIAAFAVGAVWTQTAPSTAVATRFMATHPDRGSTEARRRLAEVALQAIPQKPLFGWGPGRADVAFREAGQNLLTAHQQANPSAHNWFLDAQLQRGALGLFATLWVLFVTVTQRRRQPHCDLCAASMAGLAAWFVGMMVGFSTVGPWLAATVLLGLAIPTEPASEAI